MENEVKEKQEEGGKLLLRREKTANGERKEVIKTLTYKKDK